MTGNLGEDTEKKGNFLVGWWHANLYSPHENPYEYSLTYNVSCLQHVLGSWWLRTCGSGKE